MNVQLCNDPETEGDICFYEQKHYWLSNFSAFQVEYDGKLWPTSEHAYQAMKFADESLQERVREQLSAHQAMKHARSMEAFCRPDWGEVKVPLMVEICRAKLEQHPYIQRSLLKTGNRKLVEASPVDAFWGWGPNKDGRNELGNVWMKLRSELQAKQTASPVTISTKGEKP